MNKSDNNSNLVPKSLFGSSPLQSENEPFLGAESSEKPWVLSDLDHENQARELDLNLLRAFLLGKSKRTIESYERIIWELFSFLGATPVREVGLSSLQSFLELKTGQAHESKRLRLAVVRSFFTYALKSGYLKVNPAYFLPKMEVHHKISERYLSREDVFRMIELTTSLRDRVILKILYTAGLRLSELVALKWEHVQARENGEGQLLILGKGNKKRVVMLSTRVFQELNELKLENTQPSSGLFISREWGSVGLCKRAVQKIVDLARLRAGIVKRVTPHWLRHAHASHALEKGAPIHLVQATLGHSSVATTGRYLHARPQESSSRFLDY